MTTTDGPTDKTSREKLAEVLKRLKAEGRGAPGAGSPGRRSLERNAAALSASKSKPAPRKG